MLTEYHGIQLNGFELIKYPPSSTFLRSADRDDAAI